MFEEAKLLHEQTGLKIVKNAGNNFVVCTLHYTADPAKRSAEWAREAAAGLTPEKFAREYNIDYTAVLGAKVFPEMGVKRNVIVVPEPYPDFGAGVRYWGGFDYGSRNPSSFHVYTVVDGCTYSIFEVFKPCKNIKDFVEEMKRFPYWSSIQYIAADPNLWAPTQQQNDGNLISIQDLFVQAGVRNMIKGLQDEDAWIALVREAWGQDEPTFKIFGRCSNQVREFETAIYVNQSERQLLSSSYRETIADVDNHSLDDCKYFMLSRPQERLGNSAWQDPQMVHKWQLPSAATRRVQQLAAERQAIERQKGNVVRGYR